MLARVWRGEIRLWQAFWLLWIAGSIVLGLLLQLGIPALAGLVLPIKDALSLTMRFMFVVPLLVGGYWIFCAVVLWRTARGAGLRIWFWLARFFCVVLLLLTLLMLGFSAVQWFTMDKMKESGQLDQMGEQFTHRMRESFAYSHCTEEFEKWKSDRNIAPEAEENEKVSYISECIKNYQPSDAEKKALR